MDRAKYTLLLYLLSPIIWLYFIKRGIKDRRYFKYLGQRLGLSKSYNKTGGIHIHCASMGETLAAAPLIKAIATQFPNMPITITSTTPTGRDEALKVISKLQKTDIQHCYLPIDWPGACVRFINNIQPKLSILMETELWPNLLNQLSKKDIPILLANARMSESSARKYLERPKLSREIFSKLAIISAQYQSDKGNFIKLGANENDIELVGNIKFDIHIDSTLIEQQKDLKAAWTNSRPCWIAASIHPKEFASILKVHQQLLDKFPSLLLIAVARHPERFDELKQECRNLNLNFVSRSDELPPCAENSVLVGDSMGELLLFYGAADIAFVGGSLIPRGGHNPIEAAACGLPILMGASRFNFSDVTLKLQTEKALELIEGEKDLAAKLEMLLSDTDLLKQKSELARKTIMANKGALSKILTSISRLLA